MLTTKYIGWAWAGLIGVTVLGAAAGWVHLLGSQINLWIPIWLAKIACVAGVLGWAAPRMLRHLHGNPRRALVLWLSVAGCILAPAWISDARRPTWLNDTMVRYFPTSEAEIAGPWKYFSDEYSWKFVADWESGRHRAREAFFVLLMTGIFSTVGLVLGRKPYWSTALCLAVIWLAALVLGDVFQVMVYSYDIFFGSTMLGPALFDIVWLLLPTDPFTAFFLTLCIPVLAAWGALDHFWRRKAPVDAAA